MRVRDRARTPLYGILAFTAEHGYAPSADDILYYLEQQEAERHNLSMDSLINDEEDGDDDLDRHAAFSVLSAADEEESVFMEALREVAAGLTGRKAEVYEAMIQRGRLTGQDPLFGYREEVG